MTMQATITRFITAFLLAVFINAASTGGVFACNDTLIVLAEANYITLDQAVNRIRKNRKAKILSAETLQIDGQAVHVIKVLTKNGHIKKIRIKSEANQ